MDGSHWHTGLLRLSTSGETADVRSNVICRQGTTNLLLMKEQGNLNLGRN